MNEARNNKMTILAIDDSNEMAELYEAYLGDSLGHHVDAVTTPGEALRLSDKRLYDAVVCDAKMSYKGATLGGIILAEELSLRYGIDSVLLVSQFVDINMVRAFGTQLPFLSKNSNNDVDKWFKNSLVKKLHKMLARQFGFIVMPFGNDSLDKIYNKSIKPAAREAGFTTTRVDQSYFTNSIPSKINKLIKESHFVIFMTDGNNPNAYFEAGYAYCLGKEIVMCASDLNSLPFDVRENNCIVYKENMDEFGKDIFNMLNGLRSI